MKFRDVIFRFAILGSFLLSGICFSQITNHQFEELENLQKSEPRNVIIFIKTYWCHYCKVLENTTFKNQKVFKIINQNFYFIQFNAEEKRDINFAGKIFRYKPTGTNTGIHKLAETLTEGKTTYPSLIILNPQNEIIFQFNGYLKSSEFLEILDKIKP
ncbi:thioredoxin family protein [Epilithonimonas hispanica]|uniref:Thioredoxin n=1 Tax=Epilithonimonas hispanica TaxID=358687 RepID=A0A3D9CX80_9FLAO|nr:thioredoxin fold domain-containing protein [Epilithonimonas hispanica]REC70237.1 thioredoxin [Epilithonimonas hispanica]